MIINILKMSYKYALKQNKTISSIQIKRIGQVRVFITMFEVKSSRVKFQVKSDFFSKSN